MASTTTTAFTVLGLIHSNATTVEFGAVEATLTTHEGKVFKFPPQPRAFYRVKHPHRLLRAFKRANEAAQASEVTADPADEPEQPPAA